MTEWLDADGDPLPDKLELKPARLKWLFVFLICAGFVAIAIFLGDEMNELMRWGAGGFFALGAVVAFPQMIGFGGRLTLDRDGFTCASLFKAFRREWRDCSEFEAVRVGPNLMVGFSSGSDLKAHPRMSAFAQGLAGTAGALPDTYGASASYLADLMNRFRARALNLPL